MVIQVMKKILSVVLFLSMTGFFLSMALGSNVDSNITPNRDDIINVFKKARGLNENFKRKLGKIPNDEYQAIRKNLERYNEEILSPKLADAVKLLSSGNDVSMATELFNLAISYENSADEKLPFVLGEVFFNNPDLIEEVFKKLKIRERKFLYGQIKWGLENVIYYKDKTDPKIRDRTERLQRLFPSPADAQN